ncbi:hypothetical protein EA659_13515 [Pseudoxanthomonas winnipegensis]|nr:hypothetical protein EA659_13515 [Pseudoxanthomonas winnipegensis]
MAFPVKPPKAKSKSPPQSLVRDFELSSACGEREGAEHVLDAFESKEVLIHQRQRLDPRS